MFHPLRSVAMTVPQMKALLAGLHRGQSLIEIFYNDSQAFPTCIYECYDENYVFYRDPGSGQIKRRRFAEIAKIEEIREA